jgi:hypothetical protein
VPQIAQLIAEGKLGRDDGEVGGKLGEAYALALQAERYIPHDPMLLKLWSDISWTGSIHTKPSGALVYRKNYAAPDSTWELVGRSPIEKRRFPSVDSKWKFELSGFATVERATFSSFPSDFTVTMDKEGNAPVGMVRVEFRTSPSFESEPVRPWGIAGFEALTLPAVELSDYWIDKFEVTNAEFKQFVDQGGYQKQEYWKVGICLTHQTTIPSMRGWKTILGT